MHISPFQSLLFDPAILMTHLKNGIMKLQQHANSQECFYQINSRPFIK